MTTILFGAGASRGFFEPDLSTQYLTEQVKNPNNWDRVIAEYNNHVDSEMMKLSTADVLYIINKICAINHNYNFEQIAELIDKICSFAFDPFSRATYLPKLFMLYISLYNYNVEQEKSIKLKRLPDSWGAIPFLFRQIIAETILNLKQVSTAENQLTQQTGFIDYIKNKDEEVNLVSLNYDDLVISSALSLEFETGFANQGILNVPNFFNAKQVAYFPHGHVRFKFTDQTNIEYFDSADAANNERWRGLANHGIGSTIEMTPSKFAYNFNTFITTGQTKDDSLNYAPYSYYYQRLAKDLLYSERVVLIGYSFGDEHINRLLQSFIITDINHHVYIVDYYPEDVTMVDEWEDKDNIIFKINQIFGIPWLISADPTTWKKSPHNPQQVQNINNPNLGYGDIFDRVHFYKKGYLEFLKDYKNFI